MKNPDLFDSRKVTSVDIFTDRPIHMSREAVAKARATIVYSGQNTRPPMPHWSGVAGPHGSDR